MLLKNKRNMKKEYTATLKWRKKNPKKMVAISKNWYKKNKIPLKKILNERSKEWYRKHPLVSISKRYKKCNFSGNDYLILVKKQKSICLICNNKHIKLNIDHCHKKMKIRGLLCPNCNTLLGHCHENIEILKSAIKYLKKHE